jgi:hypothetical protein
MRLWLWPVLVIGTFAAQGLCAEAESVPENNDPEVKAIETQPDSATTARGEADTLREQARFDLIIRKKRKLLEDLKADRVAKDAELAQKTSALKAKGDELQKTSTMTTTVDDQTLEVKEPSSQEEALGLPAGRRVRDDNEFSPEDFTMNAHDRWSINISDFRFDAPQYITSEDQRGARRWFAIPFSVTNTTSKIRRISPAFVAWTNKGVFSHNVTGFIPERVVARSMRRPLADSGDPTDKLMLGDGTSPMENTVRLSDYINDKDGVKLSPMATFQPGETRWGVALWSDFFDEFTELKIAVHGLNNSHRYEEKMRRVLVLTFERLDDEFHVHRSELKYKDKKWEHLWMWEQDIVIPEPADPKTPQIKVHALKTPTGGDKLAWAFPFILGNHSRSTQNIVIESIAFVCKMELEAGGEKIPVEAKVIDDGASSIFKNMVLKSLGKEASKDRFQFAPVEEGSKTRPQRRAISLETGKELAETYAIFDETDVDCDDVFLQIETALTAKLDKKSASNAQWEKLVKNAAPDNKDLLQKNPGFVLDPRRRLTDEEKRQVREQVSKNLKASLDAALAKKNITAYFTCASGLSSGTYRISRSYRKPGVVNEEWLKEWEGWLKTYEKGQPVK